MSKFVSTSDTYELLEQVIKRLEKLDRIETMLEDVMKKNVQNSIEEISLHRACRTLRLGEETLLRHVHDGELKARVYRDSTGKLRYRFRLADVIEFQTREPEILAAMIAKKKKNSQRTSVSDSVRRIINEYRKTEAAN